jgi:hypothetical protein
MFIMKLFSAEFDDVFEFVKTQREETDPNEGFIDQLKRFEQLKWEFEETTEVDISAVCCNAELEAENKVYKLLTFASALPRDDPFCKALISRFLAPKEDTQGELNGLIEQMLAR